MNVEEIYNKKTVSVNLWDVLGNIWGDLWDILGWDHMGHLGGPYGTFGDKMKNKFYFTDWSLEIPALY